MLISSELFIHPKQVYLTEAEEEGAFQDSYLDPQDIDADPSDNELFSN